jgi:hypothetical protein
MLGAGGGGERKGKLQNQNNNKISVPCVPYSPSLLKHGPRPRKLIISLCTECNQIGASARQFIHVLNSYNPEGGKQALARSTKYSIHILDLNTWRGGGRGIPM